MSAVNQATRNEQVVRRYIEEVINNCNAAIVDEVLAPDFVEHHLWHQPQVPQAMEGKSMVEGIKAALAKDDPNFRDRRVTIDRMMSVDDKVVDVFTMTSTRQGKQFSIAGMEIHRLEDGKVVETWASLDRLGMYQQLGVVPATPELRKQAGLAMW
jgi:predicted SnoaL-like aldol condensation-catalyzing enzyme